MRDAHHEEASSGYSHDAQALAEEARDFRHLVSDRMTDERDVENGFGDLSSRYHAMRDEVERSHSRAADTDFEPVTQAYLDVEREMRDHGYVHDRDDYRRDRYTRE